jgi:hypothetical protein
MYLVIKEKQIIMITMDFDDVLDLIDGKYSIMDLEVIEIENFNNISNDLSKYYDSNLGYYRSDK